MSPILRPLHVVEGSFSVPSLAEIEVSPLRSEPWIVLARIRLLVDGATGDQLPSAVEQTALSDLHDSMVTVSQPRDVDQPAQELIMTEHEYRNMLICVLSMIPSADGQELACMHLSSAARPFP
jgi:hypothetical protein